jgi:hypothetical protein
MALEIEWRTSVWSAPCDADYDNTGKRFHLFCPSHLTTHSLASNNLSVTSGWLING